VNRLNTLLWFVRGTLITDESGSVPQFSIRLQANVPMGLPLVDLGACLFTWIRESTHIERVARSPSWVSTATENKEDGSSNAGEDRPSEPS